MIKNGDIQLMILRKVKRGKLPKSRIMKSVAGYFFRFHHCGRVTRQFIKDVRRIQWTMEYLIATGQVIYKPRKLMTLGESWT